MPGPTPAQKKRVNRWVMKWRSRLLLNEWYINIQYLPTDPTKPHCYAEIESNTDYFEAELNIYPHFFAKPLQIQEHTIVHELNHIHVEELAGLIRRAQNGKFISADEANNKVERLTQRIANIAFREEWK